MPAKLFWSLLRKVPEMRGPTLWITCLAGSVLAHAAAFAFFEISVAPDPMEPQPKPQTQMTLDSYQVDQVDAPSMPAQGEATPQQETTGTEVASGAIPQSTANAQPLNATKAVESAKLATQPATKPDTNSLTPTLPTQEVALISASSPQALAALVPKQALSRPAKVPATAGKTIDSTGVVAVAQPPTSEQTKAALAWNFEGRTVTDPSSLAVIQAFLEPGALDHANNNAGDVRDGLSSILAGVDCARLTATFNPGTGALELRGHVPDDKIRAPILATLQAQLGDGIIVTDNLLHLPRPQCGALSGIANVGLPQSTDQLTNALLIGEDAHAREYAFSEGQRLRFDLNAPDYDAYVYVDYFDADGQVIHLAPNDQVPLKSHAAKTGFGVGVDEPGQPGLNITIGPPFGQEIVVAFAASAPLFDDLRPLFEPAGPYLELLKSNVAAARNANPDFKGEWVYFFVTTSPAT